MLSEHAKQLLRVRGLKTAAKERLGHALWKRGYFPPRKILPSDILEACERTLGAEHPDTLVSVNHLAGWPASHGPAERCGTALQQSLGAEASVSAQSVLSQQSWHVGLKVMGQLKDALRVRSRASKALL